MKAFNKIAATALVLLATATPLSLVAQQDTRPYIDQSAKAERRVTPDELFLSITINEKDNKGKTTLEAQQSLMIEALTSLGIDVEKSLTLNFMGSEVSYTTFRRNVVPRTTATYTLKLTDAGTMQKVISALEANDITNTQLTRTSYSKPDEIYKELGIEAMKKAQEGAAALAGTIGQSIGGALSISSWTSNSGATQPRLYKARNLAVEESADLATGAGNEPQIEVGKVTYSVNVNVRFLLKE